MNLRYTALGILIAIAIFCCYNAEYKSTIYGTPFIITKIESTAKDSYTLYGDNAQCHITSLKQGKYEIIEVGESHTPVILPYEANIFYFLQFIFGFIALVLFVIIIMFNFFCGDDQADD